MLSRADLVAECRRLISETLLVAHLPADALPIHPDYGDTAVAYAWRLLREVELDGPVRPRALRRAIRATAAAIRSVRTLDLWVQLTPDRAANQWWPVMVAGQLFRRDRLRNWQQFNSTPAELRALGWHAWGDHTEVGLDQYVPNPDYVAECVHYGDDLADVTIDGAPEVLALWAEAFRANVLILNLNNRSADNFGRAEPFGQGMSAAGGAL